MSNNSSGGRLLGLDGIRALGAIIIGYLYHYAMLFNTNSILQNLFFPELQAHMIYTWSAYLVEVFIFLSGFVMAYSYKERILQGKVNFKNYMVQRYSHMLPAIWFSLGILLVIYVISKISGMLWLPENIYLSGYVLDQNPITLIHALTLTQSGWWNPGMVTWNASCWTVCVEIVMYVLFFYILFNSKGSKKYLGLFVGLALAGITILRGGVNLPFLNTYMARGFLNFSVGVLVAEIYAWCKDVPKRKNIFMVAGLTLLVVGVAVMFYMGSGIPSDMAIYTFFYQWVAFTMVPGMIMSVLTCKPLTWLMELKPIKFMGSLSFEIYVMHYPVAVVMRSIFLWMGISFNYSSPIFWAVYVVLSTVIAWLVHKFISGPVTKAIRKKLITAAPATA